MADLQVPTPRQLLLRLLTVARGNRLDAASAIHACALFGITTNNTRVALTRLLSAGLIDMVERGVYQLGNSGQALGEGVLAWHDAEKRICAWKGDWVVAVTSSLPRSPVNLPKIRERAFALVGMNPLEKELFVRPNNLVGGVEHVRQRLYNLGLEVTAPVFLASQLDADTEAKATRLWEAQDLPADYQKTQQQLETSHARLPSLPVAEAARESYLVGDAALRVLVFDPLLPEPLAPTAMRRQLFESMRHYDELGKKIWQQFLAASS